MKKILIAWALIVIAFSQNGMIATLKERYGTTTQEECTVVSVIDNVIYLTHRDRPTTVYSLSDWAIINIEKE